MNRTKKEWHSNFVKYMDFIIRHPNYKGMPFTHNANGKIIWVTTGGSKIGSARLKWWDSKRKELKLPKGSAWISKTARANHPTGEKPCQICGKVLKLDSIYPNKRSGKSPGAMSNAPDRLDGFHSYNMCCRGKHDTGRHPENLNRYGEDRRAYENWASGDWKAASWLMQEFRKHGLSPDHIGPLSLGFSHRPKFQPMTLAQNSAKNNRMSHADIQILITDEHAGDQVVSEHSKFLWDKLKGRVKNDKDALRLSQLMRLNLFNVLLVFQAIHENGFDEFLVNNFLHPEHAFFSIKFVGFDPVDGSYKQMVKQPGSRKEYKNNEKRYVKKSLEALDKYKRAGNRNTKKLTSPKLESLLEKLIALLREGKHKKARKMLDDIFTELANIIIAKNLQRHRG